jgi:hypothetical protein
MAWLCVAAPAPGGGASVDCLELRVARFGGMGTYAKKARRRPLTAGSTARLERDSAAGGEVHGGVKKGSIT